MRNEIKDRKDDLIICAVIIATLLLLLGYSALEEIGSVFRRNATYGIRAEAKTLFREMQERKNTLAVANELEDLAARYDCFPGNLNN